MDIEDCQGVKTIRPAEGRHLGIKFECASCRETGGTFVYVDSEMETETAGGGVRHMAYKCSFCSALITANISSWGEHCCTEVRGKESRLFTLDVRGGEPVELELDEQWVVESDGGATFPNADLSQDWCEYDESTNESLSLLGVTVEFRKVK